MEKKQAYQIPALFVAFLASLFSLILNKFQSRRFPSDYFTIVKLDKWMAVFKWGFYATCYLPTFLLVSRLGPNFIFISMRFFGENMQKGLTLSNFETAYQQKWIRHYILSFT